MICLSKPANVLHLLLGEARPGGHDPSWPCTCAQGPKKSLHQLTTVTMSQDGCLLNVDGNKGSVCVAKGAHCSK